jgi:hypothetical protein
MHDATTPSPPGREVVGLFTDRGHFEAAVDDLRAAGFAHADLSVLSSHQPIEAADPPRRTWRDALTAMVGEIRYEGPLVASGAIFLAGGPMAAAIAGLIGATVGGVAIAELLSTVTSRPHAEAFARAVAAGNIVLWVRIEDDEAEAGARRILMAHGAHNVHTCDTVSAAP